MGTLIQSTAPVFGIILLGYIVAWTGAIDDRGIQGLSRFTFRIAIPVMLLHAMANVSFSQPVEWSLMTAYYAGTLLAYAAGASLGRLLFSQTLGEQAVTGLGSSYSNIVVLGIPMVLLVHGDDGELPMYMILAANAAVLFFVAKSLQGIASGLSRGFGGLLYSVMKTHAMNPVIVGLAGGLTFNLAGLSVIEPLNTMAETLGAAVPACALFTLGSSLSRYPIRGELKGAIGLVCIKNVFHPMAVYTLAFFVFDLSPVWASVAVILAAQPTGVNAYLFSEDSEVLSSRIGTTVVLSTALSILSVAAILTLLP